ncbi:hypothetical protein IFM89_026576 [Coptis chinensis]|uniref:Uncharacterized protein n=1 Tax=Coptis chinensis TaxID=261450 RepID=A0A835LEM4_9MAGN|nr:hypothetical protein IFM89_026576 [Coptis chinensis]
MDGNESSEKCSPCQKSIGSAIYQNFSLLLDVPRFMRQPLPNQEGFSYTMGSSGYVDDQIETCTMATGEVQNCGHRIEIIREKDNVVNITYLDDKPVVALSTGWFNHESRFYKNITISANGHSVVAMVVDECDSTMGCDSDHDYQPPCPNNIVDASRAVWESLGVPRNNWGELDIVWSDA